MAARRVRANALLTLTALIWGFAFVAQRLGMEHVGPFLFNGVRFGLGSLILIPLYRRMEASEGVLPSAAPRMPLGRSGLILGLVLFAGASLQQAGLCFTTAGKAGFITGLYVVLVPLLGLFLKQRTGLGTWAGAVMAACGLYFLSITGDFSIDKGDLLVLVGAFFWAGHVLLVGWLGPGMSAAQAVRLSSIQFAACAGLSLAVAAVAEPVTLEGLSGAFWAILYGGFMSVGVAYTLQVVAQRDAHPAHAAIILSLESVFAAIGGYVMLDETLGLRALVGCGLMLAGMLASQLRP